MSIMQFPFYRTKIILNTISLCELRYLTNVKVEFKIILPTTRTIIKVCRKQVELRLAPALREAFCFFGCICMNSILMLMSVSLNDSYLVYDSRFQL